MKEISLRDLLEAGCHFGHQTTRWNPKMRHFIYAARDGIHIFDLAKTKEGLEAASAFAKATASQGGKILFVGTKRQAQDIVKQTAVELGMPYLVTRWVGGLITNWDYVYKRIEHLRDLKTGVSENRFKDLTKKERILIDREIVKMEKDFGGIEELREIPVAVFVADARKDASAIKEAYLRGVKVIAIVDTNADPDLVDYIIPANDDAARSVQLIMDIIAGAVEEGKKTMGEKKEVGSEKMEAGNDVGSGKGEILDKVKNQKAKGKSASKKSKIKKEENDK